MYHTERDLITDTKESVQEEEVCQSGNKRTLVVLGSSLIVSAATLTFWVLWSAMLLLESNEISLSLILVWIVTMLYPVTLVLLCLFAWYSYPKKRYKWVLYAIVGPLIYVIVFVGLGSLVVSSMSTP